MRDFLGALLSLIVVATLLFPEAVSASCAVKSSIETAAESSSVVFIGTVVKIVPAKKAGAGYSIMARKPKWERRDERVDVVTFTVGEAFKGVSSETIEITTSADGFAGYKFEGGTWLKEGHTYLVYAYARAPAGRVPDDVTEANYDKGVAKELRAIHETFPKALATEINEFNSKISPYESNVCGRTVSIVGAAKEVDQVRGLFPEAKRFSDLGIRTAVVAKEDLSFGRWICSIFEI